jgi:glycerol-3-phosphate acyltransferase PlsY
MPMMLTLWGVVAVALAYLIGAVPFGYLIGRMNGIDIRRHGSGNIGATNVTRVLGRRWGIPCFILDFLKGALPVLAALVLSRRGAPVPEWTAAGVAAATVAGHVWTVFMGFRGGKGVATSIGALLPLAPAAVLLAAATWCMVYVGTRVVSLASLAAAVVLPVAALAVNRWWPRGAVPAATVGLLAALAILIVVRHRDNIARLRRGTEHGFRNPKDPA